MIIKKIFSFFLSVLMVIAGISPSLVVNANTANEADDPKIKLGVEILLEKNKDLIKGKNVGLITNPTGVDSKLNSIVDLLHEDEDVNLTAMYGPEHGVRGDAQAGSQVDSYIDEQTGVIVHSLYGNTRKPTPEMLEGIDTLIFDIQDVGARFYTYIYTMALAMEAAAEQGIDMIILDRPNPLGGNLVDGPILEEKFSSFVGMYPIPVMHGMTVGELAYYFNDQFDINANLTVVPMEGWNREMLYDDTGLELVAPSPNMPTTNTIMVYPGAGFFEGTNLSEGRGTTKPFELVGAPFISAYDYAKELNQLDLPGVKFRAASFTPISSKHQGTLVHGVQIHVLNPRIYEPLETGLKMIIKLQEMYPEEFVFTPNWNNTSYFFNTLMGNEWIRKDILAGKSYEEISSKWQEELNGFKENRKPYLIYENVLDLSEVDQLIDKGLNLDENLYTEESVTLFKEAFNPLVDMRDHIVNEFTKNRLLIKLNDAFSLLEKNDVDEDMEAAEKVIDLIDELPVVEELTLEDTETVKAARAAYDDLSEEAKNLVTNIEVLEEREAQLADLETATAAVEKVEETKTQAAFDAAQALVSSLRDSTAKIDLQDRLDAIELETPGEDEEAKQEAMLVERMIYRLPNVDELTVEDAGSVEAARAAYDALSDQAKTYVTTLSNLELRENRLAALSAEDEEVADKYAVLALQRRIYRLPSARVLTAEDAPQVEAIRADYDALNDPSKDIFSSQYLKNLVLREEKLAGLEKNE